jgi:ABC-type Zn2+ transport system substrate-binding protein/surface adhesin
MAEPVTSRAHAHVHAHAHAHAHAPDHAHTHAHVHADGAQGHVQMHRASLLAASAGRRLILAGAAVVLLWLAIAWALSP